MVGVVMWHIANPGQKKRLNRRGNLGIWLSVHVYQPAALSLEDTPRFSSNYSVSDLEEPVRVCM